MHKEEERGTPDFAPIWNLLYRSFNRELGNLSVSKLCRIWVVHGRLGSSIMRGGIRLEFLRVPLKDLGYFEDFESLNLLCARSLNFFFSKSLMSFDFPIIKKRSSNLRICFNFPNRRKFQIV